MFAKIPKREIGRAIMRERDKEHQKYSFIKTRSMNIKKAE